MEPQSPPKRMTRARAAAKTTDSSSAKAPTAKIVTAAAKAKTIRKTTTATTTITASTNTKRKTRSDEVEEDIQDDEDDFEQLPAVATKTTRATRGRAKKPAEEPAEEAEAPAPRPRGRPRKIVEPAKEEPPKTARSTRTKKIQRDEENEPEPEPVRKTTRARAASAAASKPATKTGVKKTVKFEEPEKENVIPAASTKTKAAPKTTETGTGMRAKPVRRAAAATTTTTTTAKTTRSTRTASTSASEPEKPKPLSPRKISQMELNGADSEDELAGDDRFTLKPMMRGPVKPPISAIKPVGLAPPTKEEEKQEEDSTVTNPPDLAPAALRASPARRPPASPWKDSMKSPAKRFEGMPSLALPSKSQQGDKGSASGNAKVSLLQSPAKRPQSPIKGLTAPSAGGQETSTFKRSLFSSPAKRPASPAKQIASTKQPTEVIRMAEHLVPAATPLPVQAALEAQDENEEVELSEELPSDDKIPDSPTRMRFPGRLSAVLPRHADPALKDIYLPRPDATVVAEAVNSVELEIEYDDPMVLDTPYAAQTQPTREEIAVPALTPGSAGPLYGLRDKDLELCHGDDSESEDELASPEGALASYNQSMPATPCPAGTSRTPKSQLMGDQTCASGRSTAKRARMDDKYGFTPLANALSGWSAGPSPLKTGINTKSLEPEKSEDLIRMEDTESQVPGSPMGSTFFDEAMSARPVESAVAQETSLDDNMGVLEPEFSDVSITEEDMALAAEAHEMSLMEPPHMDELVNQSAEDALSEASQEYGDENAIPIDPALRDPDVPPVTPKRIIHKEFHTVSKVPLKPADEPTPRPKIKKRSHSISRLPVQRPTHGLTRNATVISYSPMKRRDEQAMEAPQGEERAESAPPVTPAKSEASWSTMGTPARTPRSDVNPALLRGAVVFVDVHTSEGADASSIFVELLTQMGARCVKSWPWSPTSPPGKDGAASRVGITHVVYKDGGKRTLEKVRESGGVVQCVGVSWVLDCERENQWLDEAPYYIDTSLVPRGGARRRKSMEPKALSNMNGMLVETPSRASSGASARECQSAPSTPVNRRRESGLWMRTPEEDSEVEDDDDYDGLQHDKSEWDDALLTPVPKTPAPEAIARFAANVTPATPSTDSVDDDALAGEKENMMARTCPPKTSNFQDLGQGILAHEKDQGVLMRLMAARRKSLQFAPKIGSPLSKAWN
ncbi:hypothetical protein GQ53DRAFT_305655 [Thozetella sp. PMI_491]|nr:hypothetical protein GQ53DRAFT_305655 [Thozetella sp. PMI_491]